MEKLRERTGYMRFNDGEVVDMEKDGRWVDVVELSGGGAMVKINTHDLVCLSSLGERIKLEEVEMMIIPSVNHEWLIPIDKEGRQIPYGVVMKALFD